MNEGEAALEERAQAVHGLALSATVRDDADYRECGELVRRIKGLQKEVEAYWEPLRVSTKEAYDVVLHSRKIMLDPLKEAEKVLKDKMGAYTLALEKARKAERDSMRRDAEAERERLLQQAEEAEASGDIEGAAYLRAQADIMDGVAVTGGVQTSTPRADGVSQSRSWKIVSIDSAAVPIACEGTELRPVDEKAVMRLIRASKGTVQIPGVVYEETVTVSVRR